MLELKFYALREDTVYEIVLNVEEPSFNNDDGLWHTSFYIQNNVLNDPSTIERDPPCYYEHESNLFTILMATTTLRIGAEYLLESFDSLAYQTPESAREQRDPISLPELFMDRSMSDIPIPFRFR